MKTIVKIAVTAALVAGATAELSNQHQHMHRHRHAARKILAQRGSTVAYDTPVETAYVYSDGEAVSLEEAKACIANGNCVVVGTANPTFTTPTPSSTPTPEPTSTSVKAAVFIESKSSSVATTLSTEIASSSTSTSSAAKATSTSSSGTSSGSGSDKEFPSGTIPCSQFPSEYGAVALDWIGNGGWASVQKTGSWTPGVSISTIVEGLTGGCVSGAFCSYACAPGYSKAQWPTTSQGSTGQSIGGLWCNANGYLERTNDNFTTLCTAGEGGVTIKNELSENVAVCATNYPGNENMNIPTLATAGGTNVLDNINAKTAYQWQGKYTSGQFYVNKKGVTVEQGCVWTSTDYPDSAGNWAPVNIGAGKDINGITYLSIFANKPTSSALLDFDIEITGDISAPCYLKSGSYYGGGTGCTTAISSSSGSAVITFKATGSS